MRKHFPEARAIWQVYAVAAVLFAGWTITAFLWRLSAWLLLLNLGEIFTVFSYALAGNFLESLLLVGLLLLAAAVLPAHLLRDDFAVRGTILAVGFVGALMAFLISLNRAGLEGGAWLVAAPLAILALMLAMLLLSEKDRRIRSAAAWLSDRVTVFLFLLLPLFALLSLYVVVRNLT